MSNDIDAVIPARFHNDTGRHTEILSDAVGPISRLSHESLVRLGCGGFRHSSEADSVAWDSDDEGVQRFLREMEVLHKYGYDGGYEVEIETAEALTWLKANRPDVYAHVVVELAR